MNFLKILADNRKANSFSTKLRRKRFAIFTSLISTLPRPLKVLDVGGSQLFWKNMSFTGQSGVKIVLLNVSKVVVTIPNFESMIGDGRNMSEFKDKEFDIVFSNSVLEHVGDYEQQHKMAEEVSRVGKRLFLQTPNLFFPIEPHFLFPFFQFLPLHSKVFLTNHFSIGWYKKAPDKQKAKETVNSIRLLTEKQITNLFPGATIYKEKLFGLTKSFVVLEGWDHLALCGIKSATMNIPNSP